MIYTNLSLTKVAVVEVVDDFNSRSKLPFGDGSYQVSSPRNKTLQVEVAIGLSVLLFVFFG